MLYRHYTDLELYRKDTASKAAGDYCRPIHYRITASLEIIASAASSSLSYSVRRLSMSAS